MNDDDEVYLSVEERILWKDGAHGAGVWLAPGSFHVTTAGDAKKLRSAFPNAGVGFELVREHHDRSRGEAARAAEAAPAVEKGGA